MFKAIATHLASIAESLAEATGYLAIIAVHMQESGIVAVVPMPHPSAPPAPVLSPEQLVEVVSQDA